MKVAPVLTTFALTSGFFITLSGVHWAFDNQVPNSGLPKPHRSFHKVASNSVVVGGLVTGVLFLMGHSRNN